MLEESVVVVDLNCLFPDGRVTAFAGTGEVLIELLLGQSPWHAIEVIAYLDHGIHDSLQRRGAQTRHISGPSVFDQRVTEEVVFVVPRRRRQPLQRFDVRKFPTADPRGTRCAVGSDTSLPTSSEI